MKGCSRCRESQSEENFHRSKNSPDGLQYICKKCLRMDGQRRREKNKKLIKVPHKKKCSTCMTIKPATEFYRDWTTQDGLQHFCKECCSERRKKRYEKRKESPPKIPLLKRCGTCKRIKDERDFYRDLSSPDGLLNRCRDCFGRAGVLKKHKITDGELLTKYKEQEGKCEICKRQIIIVYGRGNRYVDTALVDHDHETGKTRGLLCKRCNLRIGFVENFLRRGPNPCDLAYLKKYDSTLAKVDHSEIQSTPA